MRREKLIVFARYPRPGKAKTGLIDELGPWGAAKLHRCLTEHVIDQARQVGLSPGVGLEIYYRGGDQNLMRRWLGADLTFRSQGRGDRGNRMSRAFGASFEDGAGAVVLVGTACPDLTADVLARAFEGLVQQDLVIGPALDGGYYLIGARRHVPELFVDIAWGTNEVLTSTLRIASDLGLSVSLLEPLGDVDRAEDLERIEAWLEDERISVE